MNIEVAAAKNGEKPPHAMSIAEEDAYIAELRADPEHAKAVYKQDVRGFIEAEIAAGATLQELSRMHAGRSLANGSAAERLELSRKAISGLYDNEERTRIFENTFDEVLVELETSRGDALKEITRQNVFTNQLGYQDAEIPEKDKKNALDFVRASESGKKYADALTEMTGKRNLNEYENSASKMVAECSDILNRLGITPTPYAGSKTWAMWDIAKQYHFLLHPEEADPKYRIADPIEDSTKRDEVVDRHVGWEAYAAWRRGDRDFVEQLSLVSRGRALSYLEREPKQRGTLSSNELAELGSALRL